MYFNKSKNKSVKMPLKEHSILNMYICTYVMYADNLHVYMTNNNHRAMDTAVGATSNIRLQE